MKFSESKLSFSILLIAVLSISSFFVFGDIKTDAKNEGYHETLYADSVESADASGDVVEVVDMFRVVDDDNPIDFFDVGVSGGTLSVQESGSNAVLTLSDTEVMVNGSDGLCFGNTCVSDWPTTCGADEGVTWDPSSDELSCVDLNATIDDRVGGMTPNNCDGSNQTLQWDGTSFTCASVGGGGDSITNVTEVRPAANYSGDTGKVAIWDETGNLSYSEFLTWSQQTQKLILVGNQSSTKVDTYVDGETGALKLRDGKRLLLSSGGGSGFIEMNNTAVGINEEPDATNADVQLGGDTSITQGGDLRISSAGSTSTSTYERTGSCNCEYKCTDPNGGGERLCNNYEWVCSPNDATCDSGDTQISSTTRSCTDGSTVQDVTCETTKSSNDGFIELNTNRDASGQYHLEVSSSTYDEVTLDMGFDGGIKGNAIENLLESAACPPRSIIANDAYNNPGDGGQWDSALRYDVCENFEIAENGESFTIEIRDITLWDYNDNTLKISGNPGSADAICEAWGFSEAVSHTDGFNSKQHVNFGNGGRWEKNDKNTNDNWINDVTCLGDSYP